MPPRFTHFTTPILSRLVRILQRLLRIQTMPGAFYYRPLAMLLIVLLLPALPRIGGSGGQRSMFEAQAQIGCTEPSFSRRIIRNYCLDGVSYFTALSQLETDSVQSYLALHQLPLEEASTVYDLGRPDLREAIRGMMLLRLIAIVKKDPASRTAQEQSLYQFLREAVRKNEIEYLRQAIAHFEVFQNDPCRFQLDPVIASATGITYSGAPFCFPTMIQLPAPIPAESYFRAYGLSRSYSAPALIHSNFGKTVSGAGANLGVVIGSSAAAGAWIAGAVTAGIAASLINATVFAATAASASTAGLASQGFILSAFSISSAGGVAAAAAGPAAIVLIGVAIGIAAVVRLAENQAVVDAINRMRTELAVVQTFGPHLEAFVYDPSQISSYRLHASFVAATMPEMNSTAPLPAHRSGVDARFLIQPQPGTPRVAESVTVRDWLGSSRTIHTHKGWLVHTCTSIAGSLCLQPDGINADLQYFDWFGVPWTAMRVGKNFVHTKYLPAATDRACPVDPATGVTSGSLLNCFSYGSTAIPARDGNGNNVLISLTEMTSPAFTGGTDLPFGPGFPSTQTIQLTGNPTPCVSLTSPLGANFTSNAGPVGGPCVTTNTVTLSFNGNASQPIGNEPISFQAVSSAGSATRTFTRRIGTQLAIVTPDIAYGQYGKPFEFRIVTTGSPVPRLRPSPGLNLSGLSFMDNGDGTATISGTPNSPNELICYTGCDNFIEASNSNGTVRQTFNVFIQSAPPAVPVAPFDTTFIAAADNAFQLFSNGAQTPVTWSLSFNDGASWLSLRNNPDGTATFTGRPPAGTTGVFRPIVLPRVAGGFVTTAQGYTITVVNRPAFLSANKAAFTAGQAGAFQVTATEGSLSIDGALPAGLTFGPPLPGASPIAGTPAPGTGGKYFATVTATSSAGSASQPLEIEVNEAPRIVGSAIATLFAGTAASVEVTALGYPSTGLAGSSQTAGMSFTTTDLPASLQASNRTDSGAVSGNLRITGTPTAADIGTRRVQIRASNGIGTPALQELTLQILPAPTLANANLVAASAISRDANRNVVVTVSVANNGRTAANNVMLQTARLNNVTALQILPPSVASIPSAASALFTLVFPAASFPSNGVAGVLSISGSHSGGSFGSGARVVIP